MWTAAAARTGMPLLRALRRRLPLPAGPKLFTEACRADLPLLLPALQELASWPGLGVDWAAAVARVRFMPNPAAGVKAWLQERAAQSIQRYTVAAAAGQMSGPR